MSATAKILPTIERIDQLIDDLAETSFDAPEGVNVKTELCAIHESVWGLLWKNKQRVFDRDDLRKYAQGVLAMADRAIDSGLPGRTTPEQMTAVFALSAIRELAGGEDMVYDLLTVAREHEKAAA